MYLTELTKRLRRPLKVGATAKLAPRILGVQRESADLEGSWSDEIPSVSLTSAVDCETRRKDLVESLKEALKIEFFTIPPYLTAMWSIIDGKSKVYATLREIAIEEMYHFGFVCNLLVSISDEKLNVSDFAPNYPDSLPGGARPHLMVSLRKCDRRQVKTFANIESFDSGGAVDTIGEFYGALHDSFVQYLVECKPTLKADRQIEDSTLFKIKDEEDVKKAIGIITSQGEGKPKNGDPTDPTDGGLAHYFQFKELEVGFRFKLINGKWAHDKSDPIALPQCYPLADVPSGGFDLGTMPSEASLLLANGRTAYRQTIETLSSIWNDGGELIDAFGHMNSMTLSARSLVTRSIGFGLGNYCLDFVV